MSQKNLESFVNKILNNSFLKRMKKVIRNNIIYPLICCSLTLGGGCADYSGYDISSSEIGHTDDSPRIRGGYNYMTTSEIDAYGNESIDGDY